jgi:hypothetical protein
MQTISNLDCPARESDPSPAEPTPIARAMRRHHRDVLIASAVVVLLSFILHVHDGRQVAVSGLPGLPMPQVCASKAWFGIDCPGCGLTRSFILLAHGDFSGAYQMHRLGWLVMSSVLLQFPYRIYALVRRVSYPLGNRLPLCFGCLLIVLLLGNWLCRFF